VDAAERARRIAAMVRNIPPGRVASYGQIAELAGVPRGARQVGRVLRQLPDGHELPWHRVITASGRIAFPPDSPGFREQVRRLRAEEVPVSRGRVNMSRCRWQPDLDELIWKQAMAGEED
jgi:methylated-DNA-protein-cysteine methyltransferase-like protein